MKVRISNDGVFYTLQGEGPLVGVPSIFVRLDLCNLRCKWGETLCDAHYTSWTPGTREVAVGQLIVAIGQMADKHNCRHLVLTGGEPFLQSKQVQEICRAMHFSNIHTTIETNGTVYIPTVADLICLSPKLRSSTPVGTSHEKSHASRRWKPEMIKAFMDAGDYYFKFVIDQEEDAVEVLKMLTEVGQDLPDPEHVLFMPQGISRDELAERGLFVAEWCKRLGVRYTNRLQVDLWGNTPGT